MYWRTTDMPLSDRYTALRQGQAAAGNTHRASCVRGRGSNFEIRTDKKPRMDVMTTAVPSADVASDVSRHLYFSYGGGYLQHAGRLLHAMMPPVRARIVVQQQSTRLAVGIPTRRWRRDGGKHAHRDSPKPRGAGDDF